MMINLKTIRFLLRDWCVFLTNAIRLKLMSRASIEIENQALRSQLALFQQQMLNHKIPKPQPTPAFRQLWVLISKLCSNWRSFFIDRQTGNRHQLASYRISILLGPKIKIRVLYPQKHVPKYLK